MYVCLSVRWVYLDLDVHCGYFSRLIQRKDQDAGIDDYDVVDETDMPRIKVSVFMCMCVCVCVCVCVCLGFLSDIGRRPNLMISYVCLSVRWVYLDLDIHCGYFSRLLQRKDKRPRCWCWLLWCCGWNRCAKDKSECVYVHVCVCVCVLSLSVCVIEQHVKFRCICRDWGCCKNLMKLSKRWWRKERWVWMKCMCVHVGSKTSRSLNICCLFPEGI